MGKFIDFDKLQVISYKCKITVTSISLEVKKRMGRMCVCVEISVSLENCEEKQCSPQLERTVTDMKDPRTSGRCPELCRCYIGNEG